MKKIPQDIIGNIAVLKFKRRTPWMIKKIKAYIFLKKHKNVNTVVEKTKKFSGELRIPKNEYLAGEKTFIATYKENNCIFKFDINKTYFSPRLSNERKKIAEDVLKHAKNGSKILVCFAGIAPYPIIIAKMLKENKIEAEVISNELNTDACRFAEENIRINKLEEKIKVINEDAKTLHKNLKRKFDIILMPRPNIEETFLKDILKLAKKSTMIYYHGFGTKEEVTKEIKKETGKKEEDIQIRKAGDIATNRFRWQATFRAG